MGRTWGATGTALTLVMLALTWSACGDDPDHAGKDPESYVGESASAIAKAGETAELSVGEAKLKVPAGALESDTELTVKVVSSKDLPATKDIAVDVYEFGPEGLNFKAPAELEFDVAKVSVPKDKRIDVAVLDKESNTWMAIPPTPDPKPGKLSAKIAHFSLYTVIFSPNHNGPGPMPGQCGADFVPCGGDLLGDWSFKSGCITAPPQSLGVQFPAQSFEACTMKPGAAVGINVTGTASFASDGAFSVNQMVTLNPSIQIANTCLAEITAAEGMPVTCADLAGTTMGDICVSPLPPETRPQMSTGTYTVNGSELQQMEDGQAAPADQVTSYCVAGNTLTIRIERPSEQRVDVYVAERQ